MSILVLQLILTVGALRDDSTSISADLQVSLSNLRTASSQWAEYSAQLNALLASPQTQRSIGLLLRSGDDGARLIKRANVTLDLLNESIKATNQNVNNNVLPAVTKTISRLDFAIEHVIVGEGISVARSLNTTVNTTNDQIKAIGVSMDAVLKNLNVSVLETNKILLNSDTSKIMANMEATTNNLAKTSDLTYKKMEALLKPPRLLWNILKESGIIILRVIKP